MASIIPRFGRFYDYFDDNAAANPMFTMEQLAVITLDEAVMILTFTKCPLVFITLAGYFYYFNRGWYDDDKAAERWR